jgi:hypothetical protein
MINLNREHAFLDFYLLEKEFYYTDYVRDALNTIDFFIRVKGDKPSLAISKSISKIKKKYNIDLEKDFLRKAYRQRKAYIKNGKEEFKRYLKEMKEKKIPKVIMPKLCECGCGKPVKKGNRFIHGHNARCRSTEENQKRIEAMTDAKERKKIEKEQVKNNVIFLEK